MESLQSRVFNRFHARLLRVTVERRAALCPIRLFPPRVTRAPKREPRWSTPRANVQIFAPGLVRAFPLTNGRGWKVRHVFCPSVRQISKFRLLNRSVQWWSTVLLNRVSKRLFRVFGQWYFVQMNVVACHGIDFYFPFYRVLFCNNKPIVATIFKDPSLLLWTDLFIIHFVVKDCSNKKRKWTSIGSIIRLKKSNFVV